MTQDGKKAGGEQPPTGGKRQVNARETAENAILRDGDVARLTLARQTALKALSDPGVLTSKRLARLGREGVARFVEELRSAAIGNASRPNPKEDGASAKPNKPEPRRIKPIDSKTINVAAIPGWWRSTSEGLQHIETRARSDAWFAAGVAFSICFTLLMFARL